jgi:transposase
MLAAHEEAAMRLALTAEGRETLAGAAARERRVRVWRRYQAVLLVGEGRHPEAVATAVGCSRASIYSWVAAWRREGLVGLREAPHLPPPPAHTLPLEALLTALLRDDPQTHGHHATGWTMPLLHGEVQRAGHRVSEHTVRRAVRRLGWRWKRPKYVLGRPDPAYAEKRGR